MKLIFAEGSTLELINLSWLLLLHIPKILVTSLSLSCIYHVLYSTGWGGGILSPTIEEEVAYNIFIY
jgi:hypothetical protein